MMSKATLDGFDMFKKLVVLALIATVHVEPSLAQGNESASEHELLERYEVLIARKSEIIANAAHSSTVTSPDEGVCPYPY